MDERTTTPRTCPVCDDELVEFDVPTDFGPLPAPATADSAAHDDSAPEDEPVTVEVRRRAGLAALVGVVGGGVATAYLARAVDTGSALDWALCALMALVAVAHLAALVDARTPLLVADEHGVRLRLGRSWTGLTWASLRRVELTARSGLRDGRIVVVPRSPERVLDEAGAGARRAARRARLVHGAEFAVPLSLASRVSGSGSRRADLDAAFRSLAAGRTDIVTGPVEEPMVSEEAGAEHADDVPPATALDPSRSRHRPRHRPGRRSPPVAPRRRRSRSRAPGRRPAVAGGRQRDAQPPAAPGPRSAHRGQPRRVARLGGRRQRAEGRRRRRGDDTRPAGGRSRCAGPDRSSWRSSPRAGAPTARTCGPSPSPARRSRPSSSTTSPSSRPRSR